MTTVHPRNDSRIRYKEVASLAREFDGAVDLYVQDGRGDEVDALHGFRVVDMGVPRGRLHRMTIGAWRMISAVRRAGVKAAHFHDPELLPWAVMLQLSGIKAVYDVHEDVPRQIAHNPRLAAWLRKVLPPVVTLAEWIGSRVISGVIAATPEIAARFPSAKTEIVHNYPVMQEFAAPSPIPIAERARAFAYIGGLVRNRGLYTMVEAMEQLQDRSVKLTLAGEFARADDREAVARAPGWPLVSYEGWLDRGQVSKLLSEVRAGLVTLLPIQNYVEARPVKLFEYMAAGLPVIASDFPRWREIVEQSGCGLLVNPTDPQAIAAAMRWILDNSEEAEAMGERGRAAVLARYSWESEQHTLLAYYRRLLNLPRIEN
jgi:glycosyltransferase involved in cell wall biosynthesis